MEAARKGQKRRAWWNVRQRCKLLHMAGSCLAMQDAGPVTDEEQAGSSLPLAFRLFCLPRNCPLQGGGLWCWYESGNCFSETQLCFLWLDLWYQAPYSTHRAQETHLPKCFVWKKDASFWGFGFFRCCWFLLFFPQKTLRCCLKAMGKWRPSANASLKHTIFNKVFLHR